MKDTTKPKLVAMENVFTGKSYRIANKTIELDYLLDSPFNKNKLLADGSTMDVVVDNEESVKKYLARILQ